MNCNLFGSIGFICLVFACNSNNSNQKNPAIGEEAPVKVADAPKTGQLYAPLQEKESYQGVKVERDVKYGAADRNLLDVVVPEVPSSPRPVLIYVHGGGWRHSFRD